MNWLLVAVWGSVVGLDATSFPQAMVSRPLVAATLTGLLAGRPLEGLAIGAVLEAFALVVLPIGAARYPESGTAAVAGTAAYMAATGPAPVPVAMFLTIVFALLWERVTGMSVDLMRRINVRLVGEWTEQGPATPGSLERRHLGAMAIDGVRGAVVTLVGGLAAAALLRWLAPVWSLDSVSPLGLLAVAGAVMFGAALSLFGGWGERRLAFLLGILCGSILLLVR